MSHEEILAIDDAIEDEIGVLRLGGQLLAESRFALDRILREWVEGGMRCVVIVCGDLEHIDSAGLSTMIGALHRLRRQGGDLVLADMNPSLRALFELSSMHHYFKVFESFDGAIQHFDENFALTMRRAAPSAIFTTPQPEPPAKPAVSSPAPKPSAPKKPEKMAAPPPKRAAATKLKPAAKPARRPAKKVAKKAKLAAKAKPVARKKSPASGKKKSAKPVAKKRKTRR